MHGGFDRRSQRNLMTVARSAAVSLALLIGGCAVPGPHAPKQTPAPEGSVAQAGSAPAGASTEGAQRGSDGTARNKTGISACDDYLDNYKQCHRVAGIYDDDTIAAHYAAIRKTLLAASRYPDRREQLKNRCESLAHMLHKALDGKSCDQPAHAVSTD